jgi:ATPase family protein associated with various cellular activities (AAA)
MTKVPFVVGGLLQLASDKEPRRSYVIESVDRDGDAVINDFRDFGTYYVSADMVGRGTWLLLGFNPVEAPLMNRLDVGSLWRLKAGDKHPAAQWYEGALVEITHITATYVEWRGHTIGEMAVQQGQTQESFRAYRYSMPGPEFMERFELVLRAPPTIAPTPNIPTDIPNEPETSKESEMSDETKNPSAAAAEANLDKYKDVGVRRHDLASILLPTGMSKKDAASWLIRLDKEDERKVSISHEIHAYPLEGAYALYRALHEKFGFVSLEATPSFFGETPPTMVGLDIGIGKRVNVPWGRIKVPGLSGYLQTAATAKKNGEVIFVLTGETTRRDEDGMNEIVALVRQNVSSNSIYRGKAIQVSFPTDGEFDIAYTPRFMDTSKTNPDDLIFPKEVRDLVEVSLFAPIEKADVARALKIPLKRGILLEGPYGCGKTLTAYVTAKKCEESGWSFIYLDKTKDLKRAIALARQYEPCVIFAEDIDRVVEGADRSEAMDDILNTIDGIDGKASEIMVVLTTNHVEKINRAMLRPGRLDCIIPVRAPDSAAAMGLIKLYARNLIREGEDLSAVGAALDGQIPAVIRETVERAKLGVITHMTVDTPKVELTAHDLLVAARSMLVQLDLMKVPAEDKRSDREKAATTIADAVQQLAKAVDGSLYTTEPEQVAEVKTNGATQPTA